MKNSLFLIFSILFLSCGGNGNKSEKNQETTNIAYRPVAIDTIVAPPLVSVETEEKAEKPKKAKTKDSIVGSYYCGRSGDTYIFNDDGSGLFFPNSGSSCTFDWYNIHNIIILEFTGEMKFLGTQKLEYNKQGKFIIEKSEIYGKLKYTKE